MRHLLIAELAHTLRTCRLGAANIMSNPASIAQILSVHLRILEFAKDNGVLEEIIAAAEPQIPNGGQEKQS